MSFGGGAPGIHCVCAPRSRGCPARAEHGSAISSNTWIPPNARVVWGRAEEQQTDWAGVALAKALATPPVAAEWCLPLVRPGGIAVLWVGETAESEPVARVAEQLGADLEDGPAGLYVLRKLRRRRRVFAPHRRCEGNVRSRRQDCLTWRPRSMRCEPEGRRGQDDVRRQPGRVSREAGERALVVDLDPQANATSGLGMRANAPRATICSTVRRSRSSQNRPPSESLSGAVEAGARGRRGRARRSRGR